MNDKYASLLSVYCYQEPYLVEVVEEKERERERERNVERETGGEREM